MKIGFVGYSGKEFDQEKAKEIIENIFKSIDKGTREKLGEIEIVGGTTNLGVNKLIYKESEKYGYKTVGFMCEEGFNYELYPVTKLIVKGQSWGDESEEFLNYIDKIYRIGGGLQSHKEVKMAKEKGIEVIEFDV